MGTAFHYRLNETLNLRPNLVNNTVNGFSGYSPSFCLRPAYSAWKSKFKNQNLRIEGLPIMARSRKCLSWAMGLHNENWRLYFINPMHAGAVKFYILIFWPLESMNFGTFWGILRKFFWQLVSHSLQLTITDAPAPPRPQARYVFRHFDPTETFTKQGVVMT